MIYSNDLFEVGSMGQMSTLDQVSQNSCNFISNDPLEGYLYLYWGTIGK